MSFWPLRHARYRTTILFNPAKIDEPGISVDIFHTVTTVVIERVMLTRFDFLGKNTPPPPRLSLGYSTIQYNTVQYSTVQSCSLCIYMYARSMTLSVTRLLQRGAPSPPLTYALNDRLCTRYFSQTRHPTCVPSYASKLNSAPGTERLIPFAARTRSAFFFARANGLENKQPFVSSLVLLLPRRTTAAGGE